MTSFDPATAPALQRGSLDADWVMYLQRMLTLTGFACGIADGHFGPATESAVIEFQRMVGLAATGIVDSDMWSTLASGDGSSQDQSAGNAWFADAGWGAENEQQSTENEGDGAMGNDMSYLLDEQPLDVLRVIVSITRSATEVAAVALLDNGGDHLVHDVQLTLTLASSYGRQDSQTSQVGALPPAEGVSVRAQLAIMPGDSDYTAIANAIGIGALPVTATRTRTIDDDFRDGANEDESEEWSG